MSQQSDDQELKDIGTAILQATSTLAALLSRSRFESRQAREAVADLTMAATILRHSQRLDGLSPPPLPSSQIDLEALIFEQSKAN